MYRVISIVIKPLFNHKTPPQTGAGQLPAFIENYVLKILHAKEA